MKDELGVNHIPGASPSRKRARRGEKDKSSRRRGAKKWEAATGGDPLSKKRETRLERLEATNWSDPLDPLDVAVSTERDEKEIEYEYESDDDTTSEEDDDSEDEAPRRGRGKKRGRGSKKVAKKNPRTTKTAGGDRARKRASKVERDEDDDVFSAQRTSPTTARSARAPKQTKRAAASSVARPASPLAPRVNFHKFSKAKTTLAELLLSELGTKKAYDLQKGFRNYVNIRCAPSKYPSKLRLCEVALVDAKYRDARSGLRFSSLASRSILEENPPSWLKASVVTPFHDAMAHIAAFSDDDEE